MASRSFTVFQDVLSSTEAVKVKPVSSNVMATRSSARSSNIPHASSRLNDITPTDKENVDPITGERAITTTISKKRKTNVLSTKPSTPLAAKKVKSMKGTKDVQPQPKKRKAAPDAEKAKGMVKKDGKAATSRKGSKRVARKVSKLPRLEEETNKGQEPESITQASIHSRCYELTVQPLADVSQAYEVMESAEEVSTSPTSKAKFQKDPSAEPEIQDFFSSSQTLASLPSTSTARAPSSEPVESRKFSTPERKQIYAAFTFSSPSPTSQRFKSPSRSGSVSRLELA